MQAGLVNGFSKAFGRPGDGQRSLVGDRGVRHSPRADAVLAMVRESGGQAWWVRDSEILAAQTALSQAGFALAPECAAALAGVKLAAGEAGISDACLLLTGRRAPGPDTPGWRRRGELRRHPRRPRGPAVTAAVEVARSLLRAAGRRPAVVGHDLWGASGLEVVLPETVLLCLQRCDAIDVLRARGIEVFCLCEHVDPAQLAGGSSLDLLGHPATQAYCGGVPPLAILAFKPTERLSAEAAALGAEVLGGDPAAARAAENKLAFMEMARAAGVPTPRWGEVAREAAGFEALASAWGTPFVLQGPRGNAGQRTWLVESAAQLEAALEAESAQRLRVAEWVPGLPFTATGLAGEGGALLGRIEACRQVTGVDWLTPQRLGSCGNAWPEPALAPVTGAVDAALAALAGGLAKGGYAGLFGADFLLGPDGPVVIEVNPRMVASLAFATQLEAEAGRTPLLLRHLIAGLGGVAPDEAEPAPPAGSQLIVHELEGRDGVADGFASGVYRLGQAQLARLRDGAWLTDIQAPDEVLVLTRSAGEPVSGGREFARLYLRGGEAETAPGVRQLVAALRAETARPGG